MRKIMTLLAVCLFCLAFASTAMAANKFEKEAVLETQSVRLVREVQRGGYDVITIEEVKKMMDNKEDMVIIDTMPYAASYRKQHVPGAEQFLFPIPDMNEWDMSETDGKTLVEYEKLLGPDKNKPIIVYCGFVKCTRSHNGAVWAKKLGYKNVYRMPGGIFAWIGKDYKVEKD